MMPEASQVTMSNGIKDFSPYVYSIPQRTGSELYFPTQGLQASYRGFKYMVFIGRTWFAPVPVVMKEDERM
jgi:hypothetical protein